MATAKTEAVEKIHVARKAAARNRTHRNPLAVGFKRNEELYRMICLRRDGYSLPEIAQELGIAEPTISKRLNEVMDKAIEQNMENTERERQLQLLRLDQLVKSYTEMAVKHHYE